MARSRVLLIPTAALLCLVAAAHAQIATPLPPPEACVALARKSAQGPGEKIEYADCLAASGTAYHADAVAIYDEVSHSGVGPYRLLALNNWASLLIPSDPKQAWNLVGQVQLNPPPAELSQLGSMSLLHMRVTKARASYFASSWKDSLGLYLDALKGGMDARSSVAELGLVVAAAREQLSEDDWIQRTIAVADYIGANTGVVVAVNLLLEARDRLTDPIAADALDATIIRLLAQRPPTREDFRTQLAQRIAKSVAMPGAGQAVHKEPLNDVLTAFGGPLIWKGLVRRTPTWQNGVNSGPLETWYGAIVERRAQSRDYLPGIDLFKTVRDAIRKTATSPRDRRWPDSIVEQFSVLLTHLGDEALSREERQQAFGFFTSAWELNLGNTDAARAAAELTDDSLDPGASFRKEILEAYQPLTPKTTVVRFVTLRGQPIPLVSLPDVVNVKLALATLHADTGALLKIEKQMRDQIESNCSADKPQACDPREGASSVVVRVPKDATVVKVTVLPRCSDANLMGPPVLAIPGLGQALIRLPQRLSAGEKIEGSYTIGDKEIELAPISVQPPQQPTKLRMYARVGGQFFPGSPNVSVPHLNAGVEAGLTADYLLSTLILLNPKRCGQDITWGLHGYLDSRIDSISSTLTDPTLTSKGRYGTVAAVPHQGPIIEAGLWLPEVAGPLSWKYHGSTIGLFVAPIVKGGIQGRFSPPPGPGTAVSGKSGSELPELRAGPHWYYALGYRVGYMRLFPYFPAIKRLAAPELLSFVDLTVGRWSNFSLPEVRDGNDVTAARIPWRKELRTQVSIPHLPFYVGCSYNTGQGVDDLRFLVGFKEEFSRLKRDFHRLILPPIR